MSRILSNIRFLKNTSKNTQKNTGNSCTSYSQKTYTEKELLLSAVIKEWQQEKRLTHKLATESKYDNMLHTHIIPDIGNTKISNITSEYLNQYAVQKLENGRIDKTGGLSTSYVRTIMIILSSVMNYAVEKKYCKPLEGKIYKPSIEKKKLDIIGVESQNALEKYLFSDNSLTGFGILISLYMGLRIGEICALMWRDVDFEHRFIHISGTVIRIKNDDIDNDALTKLIIDRPKTKNSERDIPIPSKLFPLFQTLYDSRKSEYVISDKRDFVNPRTYEYRYHKIMNECGLPNYNYHSLRHTFATRCVEAGVDVKTLSEMLGHTDVSITLNTYVHSSIELKRKQIEKLCCAVIN